jgi:hypothetical protein
VRGAAIAIFSALLAGCGGEAERERTAVDFVAIGNEVRQAESDRAPAGWKRCATPSYDSTGNRWWSTFTACDGDVRIDVEADSILLHGPHVRVTVRTPACPAGQGAGGGSLDRAFFARPFEAQLDEVKRIVRHALAEIGPECGGPVLAPALLGPGFDQKFRDLASDWLHLSAADRRKSWGS